VTFKNNKNNSGPTKLEKSQHQTMSRNSTWWWDDYKDKKQSFR